MIRICAIISGIGRRIAFMKRIRVLSTASVALLIGVAGAPALLAQNDRGRRTDSHDQRTQQGPEQPRPQQEHVTRHDEHRSAPAPVARQQAEQREEANRAAQERSRQDYDGRVQQQRAREEQDRLQQDRLQQDRLQQERLQRDRLQQERLQQERLQQERLQQERLQQVDQARRFYDERYGSPHTYRYNVGGVYRQTNEYGVDALRQAVNNGYLEGVRAGQADRGRGWSPDYQNSAMYREADDGYVGNYVGQGDYSYYFRQGFQRGYEDGYYSRSQYGNYLNGGGSVLGNILTGILGLQLIR
ncbi:MAG: hypothetical protein ACREPM_17595 [Gemmatimonadaceae bacterium]